MENRTGEILRKRRLERSYFAIYCISTRINIDSEKYYTESKKLYSFFGCTLEGKKKYLSCILETEAEKTSEWYNFFQELKKRGINLNKTLVAYFSCSGETRKVSEKLSKIIDATLYEITPEIPYTDEDLDWHNKNSRSSIEMEDKSSRPKIKNDINIDEYQIVYLGFPIWWYVAPTIINTFLESHDFTNKKVILYCTSGSSSLKNTYQELKNTYNIDFVLGSRLNSNANDIELKEFIDNTK